MALGVAVETPWADCDREVQVRTAEAIPDLLNNLCDEARRVAALADEVPGLAREVSDAFGPGPAAGD